MRRDMDKVVTEKPRYGHANRSKKTGLKLNRWDRSAYFDGKDGLDGPKRLKSSRLGQYGWGAKDFSDRIGPLRRFLRSCVGRHWNSVYKELSAVLPKNTLTGRHIWEHVRFEVEVNCMIGEDGEVYHKEAFFGRRSKTYKKLYVHPKTGILCEVKKRKKKRT